MEKCHCPISALGLSWSCLDVVLVKKSSRHLPCDRAMIDNCVLTLTQKSTPVIFL